MYEVRRVFPIDLETALNNNVNNLTYMCCLLCSIAVEVSILTHSFSTIVCVCMSEMNISFLPSYFSSSQHHVVNSFLILILNIHNLPMLHLSWLSSVLSSFLPLKDVFCHHHTTHSFLSPAPLSLTLSLLDIFLMYAFFFLPLRLPRECCALSL